MRCKMRRGRFELDIFMRLLSLAIGRYTWLTSQKQVGILVHHSLQLIGLPTFRRWAGYFTRKSRFDGPGQRICISDWHQLTILSITQYLPGPARAVRRNYRGAATQ